MNTTTFLVSANLSMIVGDGPAAERITIPVQAQCYWEAGRFFIQEKAEVLQDVYLENGYRMRWKGELINPSSYIGGMEALEAAAASLKQDLGVLNEVFDEAELNHLGCSNFREDQPWQPHYADNDREYTQQPAVSLHD